MGCFAKNGDLLWTLKQHVSRVEFGVNDIHMVRPMAAVWLPEVDISVTLSEPLLAAPFISVIPESGTPCAVRMMEKIDLTWEGSYTILETTPSGTAYILLLFSISQKQPRLHCQQKDH